MACPPGELIGCVACGAGCGCPEAAPSAAFAAGELGASALAFSALDAFCSTFIWASVSANF
jgi:hypothetical protein